ncbi:MAG: 1-phosphofructokinase family hexose kinase [Caldisericia bacterium]|jgi:1-phosphofructokinase family hexose kinase|nr:1-phosphofructokinase family hexose kinase [Caldisericia bacterium]
MILIITFNLAIDKVLFVDEFKPFSENRVKVLSSLPGGKGVNVARCLRSLYKTSTIAGFIGGYNGGFIKEGLKKEKIGSILVEIENENRICNILLDSSGKITEIYEVGPEIKEEKVQELINEIKKREESFQYIVISGSIPKGINENHIFEILEIFKDRKIFLDIHGEILIKILEKFEIFFLKINENEFKKTFNASLLSKNLLINIFKNYKICLPVITLGEKGAIFLYKENLYKITTDYKVKIVNPVGAGDSFMGGFVYGIDEGMNIFDALKYGTSASISNLSFFEGGKVNKEDIENIFNKINILLMEE